MVEEIKQWEYRVQTIGSIFGTKDEDIQATLDEWGSEGWEAIVEVDGDIDYNGDLEELVEDHIVNYMIENDYYQAGDIDGIEVIEMCRYSRPIFKIEGEKEDE